MVIISRLNFADFLLFTFRIHGVFHQCFHLYRTDRSLFRELSTIGDDTLETR